MLVSVCLQQAVFKAPRFSHSSGVTPHSSQLSLVPISKRNRKTPAQHVRFPGMLWTQRLADFFSGVHSSHQGLLASPNLYDSSTQSMSVASCLARTSPLICSLLFHVPWVGGGDAMRNHLRLPEFPVWVVLGDQNSPQAGIPYLTSEPQAIY